MKTRRFWIRLRRILRHRILRIPVPVGDAGKSRRDLLDELYLLRDVAGQRLDEIAALEARIDALTRDLDRVHGNASVQLEQPAELPVALPSTAMTAIARSDADSRLFVDVTELALRKGQTGIQRLVRQILIALLKRPPGGFRVEAVQAGISGPFRSARAFVNGLGVGTVADSRDAAVEMRSGDVFLGLDHSMYAVIANAARIAAMREKGVRIWFVCNDVLPLTNPEWFPPDVAVAFKAWFATIARVADGIACISRTTQVELERQLDLIPGRRNHDLRLGHFRLGGDVTPDDKEMPAPMPEEAEMLVRLGGVDSFLIVGTLEPRKGHAQALEAFEHLWRNGDNVALVLVGLPGWMTDVMQRRIRHHDEHGTRLFWCTHASDALVARLYATCTALLAPSEGEGFGLPLVEAARHGLPILCRDIPVFREVAGEHASYFNGMDAASLATAVRRWLAAYRGGHGHVPGSTGVPTVTWSESAAQLAQLILERSPEPAQSRQPHGVHA